MQFAFFNVPVRFPEDATDELNQFLKTHRVANIEKEFHADGQNAFWSFCVTWSEDVKPKTVPTTAPKVDYREILDDQQFQVFSQLREVRKQLAEKEGVPVYAVASNEQLADMVRNKADSQTALGKIKGFGKSKVDRYSAAFLKVLASFSQMASDFKPEARQDA